MSRGRRKLWVGLITATLASPTRTLSTPDETAVPLANPLVVGSSPTRPTQRLFCKIRLAESSFMGGEVPASALGIQRFDGSLPSRPDNVQRFPD
jgi:hypothetical protein